MKFTHGAQVVETITGKRVIKSSAAGATNVEEVKRLTNRLVATAAPWKTAGWAYIVDISKMAPATPDISKQLINLHKQLKIRISDSSYAVNVVFDSFHLHPLRTAFQITPHLYFIAPIVCTLYNIFSLLI